MNRAESERWLRVRRPLPSPRLRLLCFPYAGGGATLFHSWNALPHDVEVCAVQLPGRQDRMLEPGLVKVGDIVDRVLEALDVRVAAPLALYGHSFGAMVAFAVALRLQARGVPPVALVVGARMAPQLPRRHAPIHHLPQADIARALHNRYGTPLAVLHDAELMAIALPPLRTDLAAMETYSYPPAATVDVPITALGGRLDHANESRDLAAWKDVTTRAFALHEVEAGHFFVDTHGRWVQERVTQAIAGVQA